MRIRRFRKGDAGKVSRMIRSSLYQANIKDYPAHALDYIAKTNSPSELIKRSKHQDIFVVVDKNRIIGTSNIEANHIGATFVHLSRQRMGAGSKLIRHMEKIAKKRGIRKLILYSALSAWCFYKKLGYKKIRIKRMKIGRVVLMEKRL